MKDRRSAELYKAVELVSRSGSVDGTRKFEWAGERRWSGIGEEVDNAGIILTHARSLVKSV